MDRTALKAMAKEQIRGNVWMFLLCTLIVGALSAVIPGVATVIIGPVLAMGLTYVELDIRSGKGVELGRLFDPFHDFGRVWVTNFCIGLFTFLWSLLFFIPGIVKSYSYSMAPYIIAENPDVSATEAITMSRRMMDGHKWELFVLDLSFIGWWLLCCITFGLASIYVAPYMAVTRVNFYDSIKNSAE